MTQRASAGMRVPRPRSSTQLSRCDLGPLHPGPLHRRPLLPVKQPLPVASRQRQRAMCRRLWQPYRLSILPILSPDISQVTCHFSTWTWCRWHGCEAASTWNVASACAVNLLCNHHPVQMGWAGSFLACEAPGCGNAVLTAAVVAGAPSRPHRQPTEAEGGLGSHAAAGGHGCSRRHALRGVVCNKLWQCCSDGSIGFAARFCT